MKVSRSAAWNARKRKRVVCKGSGMASYAAKKFGWDGKDANANFVTRCVCDGSGVGGRVFHAVCPGSLVKQFETSDSDAVLIVTSHRAMNLNMLGETKRFVE